MSKRALALTFIGICGGFGLFSVLAQRSASFDPDDAALGQNTTARIAVQDGLQVSSRAVGSGDIQASFHTARAAHDRVALWLGGSQLHGINAYEPGDELAVFYANERAQGRHAQLRYLQISLPNANWNELLVVYLQLRRDGVVPDWLVLAMTYDDLREPGIRPGMLTALPAITDELIVSFGEGMQNLRTAQLDLDRRAPIQRTVTSGTPQERLEEWLSDGLASSWRAYAAREKLHSLSIVKTRILLGSMVGSLLQRRAPPIPDDLKSWNEAAFETLLRVARADDVRVLLYKPPHAQYPGPFYHDRVAYDAYHAELRERANRHELVYVDLETLVPTQHWGFTNEGRPDFFHFGANGHHLLGDAIDRVVQGNSAAAVQ